MKGLHNVIIIFKQFNVNFSICLMFEKRIKEIYFKVHLILNEIICLKSE